MPKAAGKKRKQSTILQARGWHMMYLRIVSVLCATVPFLAGCDRSFRVNFDLQQRYVTLITEPQGAKSTKHTCPETVKHSWEQHHSRTNL